MHRIYSLIILFISLSGFSQTLPSARTVDWTLAGLRDTTTLGYIEIDMHEEGVMGDGLIANDSILNHVISSISDPGAILNFPEGNFLFKHTIHLPSHIIVKGENPELTTFTMDMGGSGHAFQIQGQAILTDTSSIIDFGFKDSNFVRVSDPNSFQVGDWIQILQNDTDLVSSSWAEHTVGQMLKIEDILGYKIVLESPLRMDLDTIRSPYIVKIIPAENVGIECLKILRIDDTAPQQSSNISFSYAVNCWVSGIESENCTFSHIEANRSSNLYFSKSYFHHAFEYGGGGRAYGVMLQATSNECLVENNIFEHLRHAMIVQSGANGNVFAYNYSLDPYWETVPNNASGDLVLHGNYVFANLFEQNICRNIVIDNSHGANGPFNTFFRNRAEGFGIFFSASNSAHQNILGNEITNTSFPYNLVNYNILGLGHFLHGNNNKGIIHPAGTNELLDLSYAYAQQPDFISSEEWAGIGTPNTMGAFSIPAYERYQSGEIFSDCCNAVSVSLDPFLRTQEEIIIFPNPVQSELNIESSFFIENLTVINVMGEQLQSYKNIGFYHRLNTADWDNGVYFLRINFSDKKSITRRAIKAKLY